MLNRRPIKVAHLTTLEFSQRVRLLSQLKHVQEMGFEVTAISSHESDNSFLEPEEIRHLTIPLTGTVGLLTDLVSLWKLWQVMRKEGFAIVHIHTHQPGWLSQLVARLAGVPIVVTTTHPLFFPQELKPHPRRFNLLWEKIGALGSNSIRVKWVSDSTSPQKTAEWFEEELVLQKVKSEYARLLKQVKPAKAGPVTRDLPPSTRPAAFL